MLCLVWLLVLCCAAGGHGGRLKDTEGQVVEDETDTILKDGGQVIEDGNNTSLKNSGLGIQSGILPSVFVGTRLRDRECVGANGQQGTCYSRNECYRLGGIGTISRNCAQNWDSCCIIQKSCASSTNYNNTQFTNPGYPAFYRNNGQCGITVYRSQPNICQLRVDFLDFTVTQPNAAGTCVDDYFEIIGCGAEVPNICGENSGQHVYVDFQQHNTPIRVNVRLSGSTFNRKWNIKLTQIECTSPERAPAGALMYFRELEGNVKSFNYGQTVDGVATRQLANTNYGVFVLKATGYCAIQWEQDSSDPYSFTVSQTTKFVDPALLGTTDAAERGDSCTTDYVVIPNTGAADRFCGNGFVQLTTSAKPFVLTAVTNGAEGLPDLANRGFSLSYKQIPC